MQQIIAKLLKVQNFVSLGSLLDYVYVKQSLLGNFKDIKCEVKGVYYSDHDSVQTCLSKE